MKALRLVISESWKKIDNFGKRTLIIYCLSLIIISSLDGFGLVLLSKITGGDSAASATLLSGKAGLGLAIIGLFVSRSLLAAGITWLGYAVFARQEVRMGDENFRTYQNMRWDNRTSEQVSDMYAIVDRGPYALVQQLMLPLGTTIAEIFNALLVFIVLIFLDPITAITTGIFFLSVAVLQHRLLSLTMSRSGQTVANETIKTYNILSDAFALGKVLQVMPSQSLEKSLHNSRLSLAQARAKTLFLESLPRYLMESMLAVGVCVIGLVTVVTRGDKELLAALSVFGVAGFRLLPIVNRIQGLILSFIGREPLARLALREVEQREHSDSKLGDTPRPTDSLLRLKDVSYTYPGSSTQTLKNISVDFERGLQYAIVGPSGSGKTTFVDLCMGLLNPISGHLEWNTTVEDSVGYVPQDSQLAGIPLASNVALEWDMDIVDIKNVSDALHQSSLGNLGLEETLSNSERLIGLSGGQRQRVGLARALYRKSSVLFLDEPTSALDAETEHEVMKVVNKLKGRATVFIVAHRLSTIRSVDKVLYIDNGTIAGVGTFEELRKTLPQFARQVELGLLVVDE
jgi:ABC-type multidrug transport system fused ATPase/permease subunit